MKIWMIVCLVSLCCFTEAKTRVYDCFPFFNELELLHLRLSELDECVDYFVIVESVKTQKGEDKALYFKDNKSFFHNYLHKIIHVIVKEGIPKEGDWEREHYQRECIRHGLTGCKDEDLILISDLDEIPRPESVLQLKRLLKEHYKKNKKIKRREFKAYALEQDLFYFHLNRLGPWSKWHGTVGVMFADLKKKSPQYFRNLRDQLPYLPNAGWHFSWMGGMEKIRTKFASVADPYEKCIQFSDEEIKNWLNATAPTVVPLDQTFPRYVLQNQDYLRARGFIDDEYIQKH